MPSSNVVEDDQQVEAEAAAPAAEPAPAPLIMLEPLDESGVCAVDGWCD
ncbi:hypothetical protein OWR29_44180 [Actinoplanes sp. Pm04-4]|uniref:Uncharacterized protein n=1 Tax=Paractinoplanes pyxinae TaxID=2997416 RepID=A0ABT4BEU4_9ACTN|nr:hypothetical protein [Actinoplanes pyxinae]MCY1145041.1 hypothetical protein [Actinoplanes pyxinae]